MSTSVERAGRRRRSGVRAALLTTVAMLAVACGSSGGSSESNNGPDGDPVSGGTLRTMSTTEPRSLDPATLINSSGLGESVGNSLFGMLVSDDPETGELTYEMAESMETSDGGTTWTLKLKPGLTFTDGTPLDAEAVAYNWERTKDPEVGSAYASHAAAITGYKPVDATTLEFTLNKPQANFPYGLITNSLTWIASPTALAKGQAEFDKDPVGAGPFKFESWARGGKLVLVRNDDYYDAPRPYLDRIELTPLADTNQRVDSVAGGNADLVPGNSPPARARAEAAGLRVHRQPINGGNVLVLNAEKAPFDDIRAREALNLAIDRKVLDAAVNQGNGEALTTIFHDEHPFVSDEPLFEEDPKRAQELFDELAEEGKPLKFTITAAIYPEIGEAVQAQLRSFDNVTVEVEKVESAQSSVRLLDGNFQALTNGTPFADPDSWASTWFESTGVFKGTADDPRIDEVIERARATSDPDGRREVWLEFQDLLAELHPMLWAVRNDRSLVASTKVGGLRTYGSGSVVTAELWLAK